MNRNNFVPARRDDERIGRIERIEADRSAPPSLHAPVELHSVAQSEVDRAVGFTIGTATLAGVVGAGGVLVAAVGWQVPLASITALTIFFCTAALVWLSAWALHVLSGEGGIGLVSVLLQYRLLRHEQRARLQRIERLMEGDE
jgi:hypothetical protein